MSQHKLKSRILAFSLLALIVAAPAQAELRGLGKAVRLSGSPRLAGYVLTAPGLPAPLRLAGEGLLSRIGHGAESTLGQGAFAASPFLRHDPNLNGGFPEDHVTVGVFRFEIAEKDQAVEGLIAGVNLSYGWRRGLGGGTALELRSGLSLGHALGHDLMKASVGAEGCLRHRASRDLYHHGCLDLGGSRFELGETRRVGVRAGITRLMTGFGGAHELSFEGRVERQLDPTPYERGLLAISLLSAMPGPVVWSARAEIGQPIDEVIVTRARVSLGATFELLDRPTSVSIDWRRAKGSMFLGTPREDLTTALSIARPISDRVRLSVSFTHNAANAAPYDRDTFSVGLAMSF